MAAAGAKVVFAARQADALAARVEYMTNAGLDVEALVLDVGEPVAIAAADRLQSVDILVNNAGIVRDKSALERT